jgi:carbonic anhydrase
MKKQGLYFAAAIIFAVTFTGSCKGNSGGNQVADTSAKAPAAKKASLENVLTADEQKALKPDSVIQNLKDGNARFVKNELTSRNFPAMVRNAASGQYPEAVILSCIDSRIPVEDIFDKGIGDLFVARVAGNIINEDVLGSMEYACKASGARLVVVIGHSSCGAVKEAIDNAKMGNITAMLAKVKPAIAHSKDFSGSKSSENLDYTNDVSKNNVLNSIMLIRQRSPILKDMENKGEIKIVGAFYDVKTGEVTFL